MDGYSYELEYWHLPIGSKSDKGAYFEEFPWVCKVEEEEFRVY